MADEKTTAKTPAELEIENRKRAKQANDTRNQSRIDRLTEIADKNDSAAADMVETDGDKLIMKDAEPTAEEKEAAAAKEELDAQRFIAETEAKALQEEGSETAVEAAAEATTTEEAATTESTQQAAEEPAKEQPGDVKVVNGITHYLTVVNGTERWLTLEQLRTAAQKVESADEYLKAAAESVRKAARLDLSHEDEPSTVEKVDWVKTARSASMGDEEAIQKVASALDRLDRIEAAQAKPSEVTPDVLQKQIDDRLVLRQAYSWFEEQYQDVLSDPFLKAQVLQRDTQLAKEIAEGLRQPMAPKQRFQAAGDAVRDWLKQKVGPKTITAAATPAKEERKKAIVNVPSAAARQTPVKDEEAEETVEDVIQQMAKARGQARAMVHRPGQR